MSIRSLSAAAMAAALSVAMSASAEAKQAEGRAESAEAKALKACKTEMGWKNMHKGRRNARAPFLLDECVRAKLGR